MKILIIKHGALGDLFQSLPLFEAIRKHHSANELTILTSPLYSDFAKQLPYFNHVLEDERKRLSLSVILKIRAFNLIYDLQLSQRTYWYRKISETLWKTRWIHNNYNKNRQHSFEIRKQILESAGIKVKEKISLNWLPDNFIHFKNSFVLIVPGVAVTRPEKQWPINNFIKIANWCVHKQLSPIIIGSNADNALAEQIIKKVPDAINLTGKTNFIDLLKLGQKAKLAIGNDTGPMHALGIAGCSSIVVFCKSSKPEQSLPLGNVLEWSDLKSLDELLEVMESKL